jgi:glycosyltransferase involved in cell wall biosynthesis
LIRAKQEVVQIGLVTGDGGDAVQMLELSAGLIRIGWAARIIVPEMPTTKVFADRCAEFHVPVERTTQVRAGIYGAKQSLGGLLRLFARHRNAIIHLHTGDVCLPRVVLFALALIRPRRVFATIHCPYDTLVNRKVRAATWSFATRLSFSKIICPSRNGRDTQMRHGVAPTRVEIIYNCVDLKRFSGGYPERARQAIGVPAGAPLIVFSSRMEPQKRPLDALEAFDRVHREFQSAHFVFVGTGSLDGAARARAQRSDARSRIHFAGSQNNIPDWLAASTAWIMPTESENFSIALLEALAAGCPIVSTRCQGNDEVLVDRQNALVTEVGDVDAQTFALRCLLTDADLRSQLSAGARKTAQCYGSDQMVEQYVECYQSALPSIG